MKNLIVLLLYFFILYMQPVTAEDAIGDTTLCSRIPLYKSGFLVGTLIYIIIVFIVINNIANSPPGSFSGLMLFFLVPMAFAMTIPCVVVGFILGAAYNTFVCPEFMDIAIIVGTVVSALAFIAWGFYMVWQHNTRMANRLCLKKNLSGSYEVDGKKFKLTPRASMPCDYDIVMETNPGYKGYVWSNDDGNELKYFDTIFIKFNSADKPVQFTYKPPFPIALATS